MDDLVTSRSPMMSELATPRKVSPIPSVEPPQAPCYLFKFPNELVAEAISWLPHPEDILSLSYTCRKIHSVLIDPTAGYIWKHARERFMMIESCKTGRASEYQQYAVEGLEIVTIPGQEFQMFLKVVPFPIPPPFEGQSEYALARMLFAKKMCRKCEKGYTGMPWSFVLRIALCRRCEKEYGAQFIKQHLVDRHTAEEEYLEKIPSGIIGTENVFPKLWNALAKEEHRVEFRLYLPPSGHNDRTLQRSWEKLLTEYLEIEEIKQSSKLRNFLDVTLKEREENIIQAQKRAAELQKWSNKYSHHLSVLVGSVNKSAEFFATSQGLVLDDMLKSPSYRHAAALAKREHAVDITPLLAPILTELTLETLKVQMNRISTTTGVAHKTRRDEIESLYKRHKFPHDIKPTLDVFRYIPILQALQRGIATSGVKIVQPAAPHAYYMSRSGIPPSGRTSINENLSESTVTDLVNVGVMQWREGAVLGARKLLGYGVLKRKVGKNKKQRRKTAKNKKYAMDIDEGLDVEEEQLLASVTDPKPSMDMEGTGDADAGVKLDELDGIWHPIPRKLDPEMRVTSWFVCTRCTNMDPGYKRMRVLDFRGLCAHECWQKNWSKAQRKSWNVECFALAPRAIDTAKKMTEILNLDAEDPKTTTHSFKGFWMCNNCPAWMSAMVWEDLLRHCQRHETQDIAKVSKEEAQMRKDTLGCGRKRLTFADLLSGKHDKEARIKQLACVHCRPVAGKVGEGDKAIINGNLSEKIMDVHGIRQHMKAKHHVEDCRNEDFYYVAEDKVQGVSMEAGAPSAKKKKGKGKAKAAVVRDDTTTTDFEEMTLADWGW